MGEVTKTWYLGRKGIYAYRHTSPLATALPLARGKSPRWILVSGGLTPRGTRWCNKKFKFFQK